MTYLLAQASDARAIELLAAQVESLALGEVGVTEGVSGNCHPAPTVTSQPHGLIFTVVSLARSYMLRRLFNKIAGRA